MRSPTTALVLIILLSACTPEADTPTSVSSTPPPDRALFGTAPGSSGYLLDSIYTVSFEATSGSDSVTQTEETAVENALDNLALVFDTANFGMPEFNIVYSGTGDIRIKFDGADPDVYYCGAGGNRVITLYRHPDSASACAPNQGGQLTSKLTGLILHELGEDIGTAPLVNEYLVSTDLTYGKCVWAHYDYDKDSGYPSQTCEWDDQYSYALFELRPLPPEDSAFYENPLITRVDLTASHSTILPNDTVTFTANLKEWDGDSLTTGASALKKWTMDGGSWESTHGSTDTAVDVRGLAANDNIIVTVLVDDSLGYAIWPWPETSDTVLVLPPTPTDVTLPDSLVLTDDDENTLYQDITAVTTPTDPDEWYDYDWSSSNQNVARVIGWGSTATVEGYSAGTAIVTVEVEDTVSDTTIVVVECGTKWNPSCIQYGPSPM